MKYFKLLNIRPINVHMSNLWDDGKSIVFVRPFNELLPTAAETIEAVTILCTGRLFYLVLFSYYKFIGTFATQNMNGGRVYSIAQALDIDEQCVFGAHMIIKLFEYVLKCTLTPIAKETRES
jgi:hypothetical protein